MLSTYIGTKLDLAFFCRCSSYQRLMDLLFKKKKNASPFFWFLLHPIRYLRRYVNRQVCLQDFSSALLAILPKTKEYGIWKLPFESSFSCVLPGSNSSLMHWYNDGHYGTLLTLLVCSLDEQGPDVKTPLRTCRALC